ncbi:MAG TPA: YihY/virulence factor BrkB family protein [Anaerolineae bacterium]
MTNLTRFMKENNLKDLISVKGKALYEWANDLTGGVLGIVVHTVEGFIRTRAVEAAASIAYYVLFSLFPLLIFLVVIGSSLFESAQIQRQVADFVKEIFPGTEELVLQNIDQVLRLRSTVTIFGSIGLLWAATGGFTVLARHINRAWHGSAPRSFLQSRLIALVMVGVLLGLLIPSLLFSTAASLLAQFSVPLLGGIDVYNTFGWAVLTRLIPWLLIFLMFQSLYRWVPRTEVKWSEAFWGALFAATAWEVSKSVFGWYLSSGLVKYQLVYGSLGAVVALMLWIYLSSMITLLGAHLSAAITFHNRLKKKRRRRRQTA